MKNTCFAASLFLVVCVASLLAGCRVQYWYLSASKSGDTVQICLSNDSTTCSQPGGVSPSSITVYRWDNMHDNELVWDAEPNDEVSATIAGVVTYGIPPSGWTNKLTPPPLACGKAYQVNPSSDKLFGLKCGDGSLIVTDFQHLEYFFRNIDPPDAPQKHSGN